jgi:YD repeat-containing protein
MSRAIKGIRQRREDSSRHFFWPAMRDRRTGTREVRAHYSPSRVGIRLPHLNNFDPTYLDELHFEQHWHLDPTCNWKEFEQIFYEPSTSELIQERTHNSVNELTGITESTGPVWFAPVHDAGGNMVEFPTLDDPTIEFKGVYDAWNRLVEVLDNADDPVVSFAYDGLGRRIVKDDGTTERHYYYAGNQVVEEQVSGTAERQFVYGLRGRGDLVLRDREDGTNLDDERFYALQDAAANVVALGTTTGGV